MHIVYIILAAAAPVVLLFLIVWHTFGRKALKSFWKVWCLVVALIIPVVILSALGQDHFITWFAIAGWVFVLGDYVWDKRRRHLHRHQTTDLKP